MTAVNERHGHAVLDLASRRLKGRKIERVLALKGVSGRSLLEVGTGSGGIAHYFASETSCKFDVSAVDVVDTRLVRDGYSFALIDSTALPFEADTFDVVVTNHVIEHVGNRAAQLHHLIEIERVMRREAIVYFAVPNRWMLVEPHYRLPFLSWLPSSWRSAYVRLSGRGNHYDCEPLTLLEVEGLAADAGLRAENVSIRALDIMREVEGTRGVSMWIVQRLPQRLLSRLTWLIPTHIYLLTRENSRKVKPADVIGPGR